MTLGEVLRDIEETQPSGIGNEKMIRWVQQLDAEIWQEVIQTHECWEDVPEPHYNEETADNTVLLVGCPYDTIYVHWLQSRIDYELADYGRYNNSNAEFEADRAAYRAWYNRTHMPLQVRGKYW